MRGEGGQGGPAHTRRLWDRVQRRTALSSISATSFLSLPYITDCRVGKPAPEVCPARVQRGSSSASGGEPKRRPKGGQRRPHLRGGGQLIGWRPSYLLVFDGCSASIRQTTKRSFFCMSEMKDPALQADHQVRIDKPRSRRKERAAAVIYSPKPGARTRGLCGARARHRCHDILRLDLRVCDHTEEVAVTDG